MKFNHWTLDDLIEHLESLRHAPADLLDYRCITRCSGEISVYNGERKKVSMRDKCDDINMIGNIVKTKYNR